MLLLLLLLLFAECFIFLVIINKGNKPWMNEKAYTYTCYITLLFLLWLFFGTKKKVGLWNCGWRIAFLHAKQPGMGESLVWRVWVAINDWFLWKARGKKKRVYGVMGEKQSVCVCMIDANPRTFCICTKFPDFFHTQNSNQRYYKSNQILPRFLNNWLYF